MKLVLRAVGVENRSSRSGWCVFGNGPLCVMSSERPSRAAFVGFSFFSSFSLRASSSPHFLSTMLCYGLSRVSFFSFLFAGAVFSFFCASWLEGRMLL